MSLSEDWFRGEDHRNAQRVINGVSASEAASDLWMWHSSVRPIAIEMAEWVYENWPLEKFFQLSDGDRRLLVEIIETEILPRKHTSADQNSK